MLIHVVPLIELGNTVATLDLPNQQALLQCVAVSRWKNTTKHMRTQKRCQLPNSIEVMARKLVIALYP